MLNGVVYEDDCRLTIEKVYAAPTPGVFIEVGDLEAP